MIRTKTDLPFSKQFDLDKDISNKLGDILLKKNIIDPQTLAKAVLTKNNEKLHSNGNGLAKRNLAQILVQDFKYEHDIIFREVANLYAFRTLEIDPEEIEGEKIITIKQLVNSAGEELKKLMISNKVIPVKFDDKIKDKLILAAVDPTLREIPKIAYSLNAKSYEVYYLPSQKYEQLIANSVLPANEYLRNFTEETYNYQESRDEGSVDESLLEVEINKSALINLFEGALVEGVRRGASDLHIIPISSHETDLSFRIDGRLNLWHRQSGTLPEAMIAVVKDRSRGLDRFEREQGQDGYIQREIDGHVIRFRVSILPIAGSEIKNRFESVVIRILDDRKVISDLDELGLTGYAREAFQKAISKPQGMVILTGPTGCGKSTTIIAALSNIMDPSLNVLTVEDPIEYVIKGARQIKLSHKMNFDQAIRSILRHDPDVVLVGEIRDRETADIAIKLANTGHLTFTTLHTNDAPSVVSRLYKMGIEPFLLAYAINVIVAQRLIRKLCPKCKKNINGLGDSYITRLKLDHAEWDKYEIFEPVGCEKCGYTGFNGRLAIHETLLFTKDISQLIFNAGEKIDEESLRRSAKKDGMLSLRESGFEKVKMGLTSFEEVLSNTTDD
ncbi:MAG: GspE/PulE family protein [Ignavibacteriaceae bacterium]|nr:GspE/PulE family protein [Ignavibacteriaceae bacterium]